MATMAHLQHTKNVHILKIGYVETGQSPRRPLVAVTMDDATSNGWCYKHGVAILSGQYLNGGVGGGRVRLLKHQRRRYFMVPPGRHRNVCDVHLRGGCIRRDDEERLENL